MPFLYERTESCSQPGITTAWTSTPVDTVGKQAKLALCMKAHVLSSEACVIAQLQVYAAWVTGAATCLWCIHGHV